MKYYTPHKVLTAARKIKIYGFWAKDNLDYCNIFEYGHKKVLTDHGLNLTSNNNDWKKQENVFVFLAFEGNNPVGGIRFEKYDPRYKLSVERALSMHEPNIVKLLKDLKLKEFGEACGLWNDKVVSGEGLSIVLSHLCFIYAPMLDCNHMIAFNGIYTYKISQGMGGEIVDSIGDEGIFKYPNERFKSAVWKFDLNSFKGTTKEFEKRVLQLRKSIEPEFIVNNTKNGLHIKLSNQI
jgi:hypothetical protein